MPRSFSSIKQNAYQRRLAVSLAGLKSGSRYAVGGVGTLFKRGDERRQARNDLLAREARRFVEELGQLKGAYVKIGQMLAIYGEHVLPAELVDALSTLNDQTAYLEWSVIETALKAELGERIGDFDIQQQPVAAASLAQVHKAIHKPSGKTVALKVQYPGVAQSIDSDFNDVVRLLNLAKLLGGKASVTVMLEEVRSLLRTEVDYLREAQMTQQFQQRLKGDTRYLIPELYTDYCTSAVLVMDFVQGDKFDSEKIAALPQTQRNNIAKDVLALFFSEVFAWSAMQTDPNFGNYLVDLNSENARLSLLDFGAVREFNPAFMNAFAHAIAAAAEGDLDETAKGLEMLGCFTEDQSQQARDSFASFCLLLVEPFRHDDPSTPSYAINTNGEYRWAHANLVRRAAKLGASSALNTDFTTPPKEFALITRKLSGVFSAMAALGAELNTREMLFKYVAVWRQNPHKN